MTAKEYLSQARQKEAEIRNLQNDKELLAQTMYSLGGAPGGQRVQASRCGDRLGSLYARIDEKEREISQKIEELIGFKLKISSEVNAMDDPRHIEILHRKYVRSQSWGRISADMGYATRYAQQLNGQALAAFEEKYKGMLKAHGTKHETS